MASNAATVCSPVSRLPLTKKEGVEFDAEGLMPARARLEDLFEQRLVADALVEFLLGEAGLLGDLQQLLRAFAPSTAQVSCVSNKAPTIG